MIDEIYDRQFQLGRKQMSDGLMGGLTKFGRAVRQAFEVLNRIEYQAPWATPTKRARCN